MSIPPRLARLIRRVPFWFGVGCLAILGMLRYRGPEPAPKTVGELGWSAPHGRSVTRSTLTFGPQHELWTIDIHSTANHQRAYSTIVFRRGERVDSMDESLQAWNMDVTSQVFSSGEEEMGSSGGYLFPVNLDSDSDMEFFIYDDASKNGYLPSGTFMIDYRDGAFQLIRKSWFFGLPYRKDLLVLTRWTCLILASLFLLYAFLPQIPGRTKYTFRGDFPALATILSIEVMSILYLPLAIGCVPDFLAIILGGLYLSMLLVSIVAWSIAVAITRIIEGRKPVDDRSNAVGSSA